MKTRSVEAALLAVAPFLARCWLWLATAVLCSASVMGCRTVAQSPATDSGRARMEGPLKVYILAGQSNMQGQARKETISRMALSSETKELHDKIVDADGKPRVHKNVTITAISQKGRRGNWVDTEKHGNLTVGYGNDLTSDRVLGLELGFGITMEEAVGGEPILIIKTAWGGKSLNEDFRPPSAGLMPMSEDEIKKLNAKGIPYEKGLAEHNDKQGKYYRMMLAHVKEVLADPGKYCAAYNPQQGYEIAGFAWFQGFNDIFAYKKYGNSFDFYTKLLALFIKDVRHDLKTPDLPFVIGVIGMGGNGEDVNTEFRQAMAATADLPEFTGNVIAVNTADYWDDEMLEAIPKVGAANKLLGDYEGWAPIGQPAPPERQWYYTSFHLDPDKQYRDLEQKDDGLPRILTGTVPEGMEDWLNPGFDTRTWQKGPAPIGKVNDPGISEKQRERWEQKNLGSLWGEGNMLLMRTTFTLKDNAFGTYRLRLGSSAAFLVYLNGHLIKSRPGTTWHNGLCVFDLSEADARHLKPGRNVLAFYGNSKAPGKKADIAVNLIIEGISLEQFAELTKKLDAIRSPRDIALSKGRSDEAYHYNGSAYTYSLIGEAMARAIIKDTQGESKK